MMHAQSMHVSAEHKTGYGPILLLLTILFLPSLSLAVGPVAEPAQQTPAHQTAAPSRLAPLGLEKLMDIEVTTVTRTKATVGESAAAVTVITQEDIRRSGATTIPELFRRVPGMNVARIDNNKWAISARGFNDRFSNKLLVLRDGRTVYDPVFSGVLWYVQEYPLEDIERIEVIRGPGASVWGANAVNGVINIITKSAKDTEGGLLSGGGGTEERGFGEARYGNRLGSNANYRVYAKKWNREHQLATVGDPHDHWTGYGTGTRVDWQPVDRDSFTFQGDFLHSAAGRVDPHPQLTPPLFPLVADKSVSDIGNILGRWTHKAGEESIWNLQIYWQCVPQRLAVAREHYSANTFDVDFQHEIPIGDRNKFNYGLGYRYLDQTVGTSLSDNGLLLDWQRHHFGLSLFSAFLQDEVVVVPETLSVLIGSKFEHNDFTGFEVQPTGRLTWTPTKQQTLWAAVSRAVRTPSVFEESFLNRSGSPPVQLPSGTLLFPTATGNPDLNSEVLTAYELGWRSKITNTFAMDLALFYNDYHRLIVAHPQAVQPGFAPGTATLPLLLENNMTGKSYGAELSADWRPTPWWRLYAAYWFLKINLQAGSNLPAAARTASEAAEGRSPQQQVFLQSSFDLPQNVELDLIGRYVDELPGFVQTIPAYGEMDVRLAWRARKNLELSVVGQNLIHSHHPEFGASSLVSTPTVELRRAVYGKLTWWF